MSTYTHARVRPLLVALLCACCAAPPGASRADTPRFTVGIELPSQVPMSVAEERALRELGIGYVNYYLATTRGARDRPCTLAEFGDYGRRARRALHPELTASIGRYGGLLSHEFRHLPRTGLHANARGAAIEAEEARSGGRLGLARAGSRRSARGAR